MSSSTSVALGPTDFHFGWLRHAAAKSRSSASHSGRLFVPITHHLVHAATVHTAAQAADLLDPVTKERGTGRKFLVVDIAVQGLVQSEEELRHATKSPSKVLQDSLSRRYALAAARRKLKSLNYAPAYFFSRSRY